MKKAWLFTLTGIMMAGVLCACQRTSSISESDSSGYNDPGTAGDLVNEYPYMSSESGLFIKRDGTIISADVEEFAADYYDAEEFEQNYAEPAVKEYNEKQGLPYVRASETDETLPVALSSVKVEDGNLTLQLVYKDAAEYLAFNKSINDYYAQWGTFVVCPYENLPDYGISIEGELLDTDGNTVDLSHLESSKKLYVCVVGFNGSMPTGFSGNLQFEGAVVYRSAEVEYTKDNANAVQVNDSEKLQYILFE